MKGKKTLKLKVIDCFYLFLSISSVKNSWIGLFTIIFKVKQNFRNGLKFWNSEISSKISKKNSKIEFSNKNSGFCQNFAMEQNLQFDKDDIEPRNWTCHFLSSMKFYNFWKISKFVFLNFQLKFWGKIRFFQQILNLNFFVKISEKIPFRMIEAVFIPKLTGEIPSRSSLNSVVLFRIKKKLSKIWMINKYYENQIFRE